MNFRTTIILFFISAVLVAGFFVLKNNQSVFNKRLDLSELNLESVDTIYLSSATNEVKLKKKNNLWNIIAPINDIADYKKINSLLKSLNNAKLSEIYKEKEINKSKINLDKKNYLKVKLQKNGSTKLLAFFGRSSTLDNKSYVKIEKPKTFKKNILLLNIDINNLIPRDLMQLKSRNLIEINKDTIRQIEIIKNNGKILLEKDIISDTEINWQIKKPLISNISKNKVDAYIDKLINTKVLDFISNDNALTNNIVFPSNAHEIHIITENLNSNGKKKVNNLLIRFQSTIPLNGKINTRVINRNGVICVSEDILKLLNVSSNDFKEKTLIKIDQNRVNKIKIIKREKDVSDKILTRDILIYKDNIDMTNNKWSYIYDNEKDYADEFSIQNFLNNINSKEVKNIVSNSSTDLEKYGLNNPILTLEIDLFNQKEYTNDLQENNIIDKEKYINKIILNFSLSKDDKVYANKLNSPFILEISNKFIDSISIDPEFWKQKYLFEFSPTRLKNILIIRKTENNILLSHDFITGEWKTFYNKSNSLSKIYENNFKNSINITFSEEKLIDFIKTLSSIQILNTIKITKKIEQYLKSPHLIIEFTKSSLESLIDRNQNKITHLILTSNSEDKLTKEKQYYLKLSDKDNVYIIDKKQFTKLTQNIISN